MSQARDVVVITSCTNRKKKADTVLALEGTNTVASLIELARVWSQQVQALCRSEMQAAVELYAGRSITEAKRAAESLSAPLHIVSAGHGLLRPDDFIPSYNVTTSPTADNVLHQCLLRLGKSPADWWHALIHAVGSHRSLGHLLGQLPDATVLLAAPSAYLSLLASELAELSEGDIARLRIITSPRGASTLPARLQSTVMPYDERLEGLATYAGTRSDFSQRALRHFVTVLKSHSLPLDVAHQRVSEAMGALTKPVLPKRQRKTDEEIVALLHQNWMRFNGSTTALLRFLRDEALVSCEQSRFRLLREQVFVELNDKAALHG